MQVIGVTNAMLIQTAKHRIATPYQQGVRECLLNGARGPVAKWMAVSHDWQLTDLGRRTMPTMHGGNVQDKSWMIGMLKNKTYEVIRGIGALAKIAWPQRDGWQETSPTYMYCIHVLSSVDRPKDMYACKSDRREAKVRQLQLYSSWLASLEGTPARSMR